MTEKEASPRGGVRSLPRNVWAASFTSFFNDISSEMVINILPLWPTSWVWRRPSSVCTYNAVVGILDFPASLIAGALWQGPGAWEGFGPADPFAFGGTLPLTAAGLMGLVMPPEEA